MNHPEDSLYFLKNRKFVPNIITSIRSDDVIVTSLKTTLSRTTSGKDTILWTLYLGAVHPNPKLDGTHNTDVGYRWVISPHK